MMIEIDWEELSPYKRRTELRDIRRKISIGEQLTSEESIKYDSYREWRNLKPGKKEPMYFASESIESETGEPESESESTEPESTMPVVYDTELLSKGVADILLKAHSLNVAEFGFPEGLAILIQPPLIKQWLDVVTKNGKLPISPHHYMMVISGITLAPRVYAVLRSESEEKEKEIKNDNG